MRSVGRPKVTAMRPKRRPRSSRPRTGDAPLPPEEPRRVQAHVHREPGLSSLEIGGGAMGVESPGKVVEERAVQGLLRNRARHRLVTTGVSTWYDPRSVFLNPTDIVHEVLRVALTQNFDDR